MILTLLAVMKAVLLYVTPPLTVLVVGWVGAAGWGERGEGTSTDTRASNLKMKALILKCSDTKRRDASVLVVAFLIYSIPALYGSRATILRADLSSQPT